MRSSTVATTQPDAPTFRPGEKGRPRGASRVVYGPKPLDPKLATGEGMQNPKRETMATFRQLCATLALFGFTTLANGSEVSLSFSHADQIDPRPSAAPADKPLFFFMRPRHPTDAKGEPVRFTVDKGTQFRVWLDEAVPDKAAKATGSDRSLAVQIKADENVNEKDKILFHAIAHNGDHQIRLDSADDRRFISFDFMLDKTYQAPRNWVLHLQVWQCCERVPIFTIHVAPSPNPNDPIQFVFYVLDDAHSSTEPKEGVEIYRMNVSRGEWNHMILDLEPSPDGRSPEGHISMWRNGEKKLAWHGHWGYLSRTGSAGEPETTPAVGIDLGVYRRRQTTTQTIYFDNVRVGANEKSVERPLP